jgi:hypothetical protein
MTTNRRFTFNRLGNAEYEILGADGHVVAWTRDASMDRAIACLAGAHSVAYRLFVGYGTADRDDSRMLLEYCRDALTELGLGNAAAEAEQKLDAQYGFKQQAAEQIRTLRNQQADIDAEIFEME